ncbi:unnamed protein product (macronuclear) [Paramecium tetraurelia]|uniref:cathepsin L n=1 Tax=Paramecium tetraurelia TaxID=5888 RepID=A0ECF4_PARTE|nr:uncharacterized protein GSPATT00003840001 [Paramecium tetraurelia]CAK92971.1 unnamed protein product [Paramecium tetraurelia]|eukprot:XP_001460368.1 hypothetical protein (macronuclear) [Paramecium tetraurelia strain d4-2]
MQKTLLVAGLALLLSTIGYIQNQQSVDEVSMVYEGFKQKFQKTYTSAEEAYRRGIFEQNYAKILAHNADPTQTYQTGVNQFTDMTQDEFVATYLTYTPPEGWQPSDEEVVQEGVAPNDSVDWRSSVRVKNQGSCGSCWAFSAVGAVEAFFKIKKGADHNLSEQQLVDCDKASNGCDGGYPDKAIKYIAANGSQTQAAYQYTGVKGTCKSATGSVKNSGVSTIAKSGLQAAIKDYPISVCVDASNWSNYKSGVFNNCNKNLNHAVMAVGYDASGNWIIKNSWATSWGEKGFMTLQAGDTCGVTQVAVKAI